ncbi:hypothetical protein TA3x_001454 [Tundrisphaera sp. TA3]|uniref:hypothetical protein n=1 Tax=Tundrisphaera sp. TA3 TaxID=3435775 RepID=UPI003EBA2D76
MSQDESTAPRGKRERSTRYPGVPLPESVELCKFIEGHGLDGLSATDIATALGYKNIKTNTFSARLSAARQFGLLVLKDEGYTLTTLARSILHPVDPGDMPRLHRQALLSPSLYKDLAERFADKRVPDPAILGNVLYHDYQIISSAKQSAAQAFLDSARFAGILGDDLILRPQGTAPAPAAAPTQPVAPAVPAAGASPAPAGPSAVAGESPRARSATNDVRIDLRLWDEDAGKSIRVRAPETMTPASFDRLIQTLRLHLRIEEPPAPGADDEPEAPEPDDDRDD